MQAKDLGLSKSIKNTKNMLLLPPFSTLRLLGNYLQINKQGI